jgi:hypothetical protein
MKTNQVFELNNQKREFLFMIHDRFQVTYSKNTSPVSEVRQSTGAIQMFEEIRSI